MDSLFNLFLKKGICGLMFVFIEEDFILESIKSSLEFLDKLVIVIDYKLDTFKKISNMKNKKIKIISIRNTNKHFSYFVNKAYKKCKHKYFVKIDADQIYIKENIILAIEHVYKNNNSIACLSGVNCFKSNNKIKFLKKDITLNSGGILKVFNGGLDTLIVKRKIFSKFVKFYFDCRVIERYVVPYINNMIPKYFGLCWLHFGPVKLNIALSSKNLIEKNEFITHFNLMKKEIISNDFWIEKGINKINELNFNKFIDKNNLNSIISILNINHSNNTKHQWANMYLIANDKNSNNFNKKNI